MRSLTLFLLILMIASIYAASSLYFGKMDEIWVRERRIEVLRNEILYLKNKADEYREMVAPLVLRLLSYSEEGDHFRILYSGSEIWRDGRFNVNMTYYVRNFGSILIRNEDGRIVARIFGMPYNYTLKPFYYEELVYVVQYALDNAGRLDEAVSKDEEELTKLERELATFTADPLAAIFLLTPVISITMQYALLRRIDPELAGKYASLMRNPYVLLPSLAVYASFLSVTLTLHSGVLIPLHVIAVLYSLTSVPSLISPILFAYETME